MANLGQPDTNNNLETLLDLEKSASANKNGVPPKPQKMMPGNGLEFKNLSYGVMKKAEERWEGRLVYMRSPAALSNHLSRFGRHVPDDENNIEYLLDVVKEYDESTTRIDPLVLYHLDGIQPDQVAQTPTRTMTSRANFDKSDYNNDGDEFDNSFEHKSTRTQMQSVPYPKTQVLSTPSLDPYSPSYVESSWDEKKPGEADHGPKFANPWLREVVVLSWRTVLNVVRTPKLFLSREIVLAVMVRTHSVLPFQEPRSSIFPRH
ncbi:ABC TRANSPORTER [Salix koriyanagi]|uniref:ABC TRANSPORTER n=1 Tax=Salix koriyanagi TaxID=2511006 RepID=A0A9Q0PGL0_9ROSI|nr:ABC TRANSPORTER [Salix koriyanagi]